MVVQLRMLVLQICLPAVLWNVYIKYLFVMEKMTVEMVVMKKHVAQVSSFTLSVTKEMY